MKKSVLIVAFAALNLMLIQNCGSDSDGTSSQRQYLDNDVNDADRSLDNDGDTFLDNDLNDQDGSFDDDADGALDNDLNDSDRSLDNDGDQIMDNDLSDPDRGADQDDELTDANDGDPNDADHAERRPMGARDLSLAG